MPATKRPSAYKSNTATLGFEEKLWAAVDKLRGYMDAAEYKHVLLYQYRGLEGILNIKKRAISGKPKTSPPCAMRLLSRLISGEVRVGDGEKET